MIFAYGQYRHFVIGKSEVIDLRSENDACHLAMSLCDVLGTGSWERKLGDRINEPLTLCTRTYADTQDPRIQTLGTDRSPFAERILCW